MVRRSNGAIATLAVLLVVVAAALAHTTAQLAGIVTDESGGALPGVEVTVTQMNTAATRFVITGVGRIRFYESSDRT